MVRMVVGAAAASKRHSVMRRNAQTFSSSTYWAAVLLPLALVIALSVMWGQRGPNADYAFAAIISYFAAIALLVTVVILMRWLSRSAAPPRMPPPASMPAGIPTGPRRPAPLVAYARAAEGETADA